MVSLPKFNVEPDALPEFALNKKHEVHKSVRIDVELEHLIEDALHDPRLGFGGHFTAFALWAFEQGIAACGKAGSDPEFKTLAGYYHAAQNDENMQKHLLNINELLSRDAAILEQWIKADETDGALAFLERMVARLEDVPVGKWYKLLAHKIMDNESVTRTLEAANAELGTTRAQRAAAISRTLEAATGQ